MYLVGDSFRVSLKWVVIISTKQEPGYTQSAKVSTCYKTAGVASEVLPLQKGGAKKVLAVLKRIEFRLDVLKRLQ